MRLRIYYYIWVPEGNHSWFQIISSQFRRLKSSELFHNAEPHICINSPYYLELAALIRHLYPWVVIRESWDSPHQYEGFALKYIHADAIRDKFDYCLYIHTKGMSYYTNLPGIDSVYTPYGLSQYTLLNNIAAWREIMEHFCVDQWRMCIKHLESVDICGVSHLPRYGPVGIINGNIYWSSGRYIKNLHQPVSIALLKDLYLGPHKMYSETQNLCKATNSRYIYEEWICSRTPRRVMNFKPPLDLSNACSENYDFFVNDCSSDMNRFLTVSETIYH